VNRFIEKKNNEQKENKDGSWLKRRAMNSFGFEIMIKNFIENMDFY
jgi:hypothetical protein